MRWNKVKIGELAAPEPGSFKIGPFGSSLKKNELVSSGIPIVGIENVLTNNFMPPFRRHITNKKFEELIQYKIEPNDVLVTTMGTIGFAAVVPDDVPPMIMDSHLFRMRVDQRKVYPSYLCYGLNSYSNLRDQIEMKSRGAIMAGLNTTILKECEIPLPPLPDQIRIVGMLSSIDKLKLQQKEAERQADLLFRSVLQRAFAGEV